MSSTPPTQFVSLLDDRRRSVVPPRVIKWALVGTVLFAASAAGGWYVYKAGQDPMARAERLAERGDLRGAMVEQRNALRKQPNNPEAHVRMAMLLSKLADPIAAEREFRAAAGLGADRWELLPDLGDAMLAQGKFADLLVQIPAHGPTPRITAKNLLLRAVAYLSMQNLPQARATLADAQRTVPGTAETALIGARVAAAENDMGLVEKHLSEALAIDPAQTEALLMQEKLVASKGDYIAALAFTDRAVKAAPWSAMARIDRATQLLAADKDALAQADVSAVLEGQPRFADAIYLKGILLARAGKYPEAAAELGKLEGNMQRFPLALYYQAVVASNLGQSELAVDFARRYSVQAPNDANGVRLRARTELAAKRPVEALAVLQKAVAGGLGDAETLDLLGQAYAAVKNTRAAFASFSKAASLAPDDPAILTHLGVAQVQQGAAADGSSTLQRVMAIDPKSRTAAMATAAAALDAGNFAQAETDLTRLRSQVGNTETVAWLAASILLRKGDLDGAQRSFAEMLRTFPGSIDGQLGLAKVLVAQGRRDAALQLMSDILAKSPANGDVLDAAMPLLLQGNQLEAIIATMGAAHRAAPQEPRYAAMLSDTYIAAAAPSRALATLEATRVEGKIPAPLLGAYARAQNANGNPAAAKASYRQAIAADPEDFLSRSVLLSMLVAERDNDAAKALLRETLAVSPGNFKVMWIMVNLEAGTNGFDSALNLARTLRQAPGNMPFAQVLRGDLFVRAGRPADAVTAFDDEFKAVPSSVLLRRIATSLLATGQEDAAAQRLRGWLQDHPDSPDEAEMLAELDIRAKRYDDAKTHLTSVLALRPTDAKALNNLAWVYFTTGDDRARATAQKAYLESPNPAAGDTLGWILTQQGAIKAAIPLLQDASTQRPDDPSIRYHLAVALQRDGRPDDARTVLTPLMASKAAFDERSVADQLMQSLGK